MRSIRWHPNLWSRFRSLHSETRGTSLVDAERWRESFVVLKRGEKDPFPFRTLQAFLCKKPTIAFVERWSWYLLSIPVSCVFSSNDVPLQKGYPQGGSPRILVRTFLQLERHCNWSQYNAMQCNTSCLWLISWNCLFWIMQVILSGMKDTLQCACSVISMQCNAMQCDAMQCDAMPLLSYIQ